ncbi:alpha/beta hydrolase [Anaerocolumna xylanovorans]|uniref:Lysophospholipase, alpha-beta hydrolase superfamily n=1 Tax=Anaerocolumna xylanovorans DSM 12503 TaxID=1121345 RepID=A0A1M7YKT9_9FIRM|nr:lysophospholipase [Anaerocolumna xylanovorans]SHO53233.1 Lysophospholipase, alpha-beta hydrolase superfamily [Anaerocolumna xylanovorans DSM 12503]
MVSGNLDFKSEEGTKIFVYVWKPDENVKVKGIVQFAHGMAETANRYERFAEVLVKEGFIVYANDHRGHGKTAGDPAKLGYLADKDGFDWLVKDIHQLSMIIKQEYPDLPLFLLGHSMGSFAVQRYIMLYGNDLKGAILSGSNGKQGIMLGVARLLAGKEVKKHGRKTASEKMNQMFFGSYNNKFKPNRTEFDWLTRDKEEVDKYVNDPFCGTVFTGGFFYDFTSGLKDVENKENLSLIPKKLPIFIFSGDKDPVGKYGKGVTKLYNTYKKYGIKDVTLKLYPGGRHEMLNEINRDEVMKDAVDWINHHMR